MALIDTNYIIRYLLHDIDEQYKEAEAVIISQELTLLPEVLMECIHVLEKLYKISREEVTQRLQDIIQGYNILLDNKHIYLKALEYYRSSSISYVDGLLYLISQETGQTVYSFDSKLIKQINRGQVND